MINPMQAIQMLSNAQNPMATLQSLFGNHPQYRQVMSIVQRKSPSEIEQYARNVCQSQGINIDSLARMFNIPIK